MKRLAVVLAAAIVAIGVAVPVALSDPAGKATGGVDFTFEGPSGPVNAHASFTAQGTPVDAKGQIQYQDDLGAFHGNVDCFSLDGPNSASFSGPIDHSSGQYAQDSYFVVDVTDNGTPGTAGPDQIGVGTSSLPQDCGRRHHHRHGGEVTNGNLDVH